MAGAWVPWGRQEQDTGGGGNPWTGEIEMCVCKEVWSHEKVSHLFIVESAYISKCVKLGIEVAD